MKNRGSMIQILPLQQIKKNKNHFRLTCKLQIYGK